MLWDLKIEECEHEELKELEKFHYRGANPGIIRKCFKAMIGNELAAGIIFVFPHFALRGRNIAFPEFKGKSTTRQVKMINEKISRISRVVVLPKFRSIGLGAEIVRRTLFLAPTEIEETVAVMARHNPFFRACWNDQSRKRRINLLNLKEFRFRDLVSCPPDCSALDAAVKMDENHVGSILVDSKETGILGVVTRRDLVHSIIVRQKDPKKTKITEVMHLSPVSINDDASPLEALKKMIDRKVQCLVVRSSDDKIVGVVSFKDVIGIVGSTALQNVSAEKAAQVFDMVKRLTPLIISRYDGEERLEMERDLNNEVRALIRLLEEAEIALRH